MTVILVFTVLFSFAISACSDGNGSAEGETTTITINLGGGTGRAVGFTGDTWLDPLLHLLYTVILTNTAGGTPITASVISTATETSASATVTYGSYKIDVYASFTSAGAIAATSLGGYSPPASSGDFYAVASQVESINASTGTILVTMKKPILVAINPNNGDPQSGLIVPQGNTITAPASLTKTTLLTAGLWEGTAYIPSPVPANFSSTFIRWEDTSAPGVVFNFSTPITTPIVLDAVWADPYINTGVTANDVAAAFIWVNNPTSSANGGYYTFLMDSSDSPPGSSLTDPNAKLSIIALNSVLTISLTSGTCAVQSGAELNIGNNITLQGNLSNTFALVDIWGGTFTMKSGSKITVNGRCGVSLTGPATSAFNMEGGEISGIVATGLNGGGVFVSSGTFTMTGGTITGNRAGDGCGVFVQFGGATFIRSGVQIMTGTYNNIFTTNPIINGNTLVDGITPNDVVVQ